MPRHLCFDRVGLAWHIGGWMDLLLIILLGGTVAYLWQRIGILQRALDELGERFDALSNSGADGARGRKSATPASRTIASDPVVHRNAEHQVGHRAQDENAPPVLDPDDEGPSRRGESDTPRLTMLDRMRGGFDFEQIFGRLLPIWAGGIALAIAGFFLVSYSIEQGLLTPPVRFVLSFAFGIALLLAAELAYRFDRFIEDPRVRQALAGAGLATLYASFYIAGQLYGLIGTTAAFLGLAAVTVGAIALSFRFGMPSAVLALVGGFAAPVLVGGEEANIPLLAIYLALVTAGLTYTGRQQHRSWLALAALGGGLGWGVMLLLSGVAGTGDLLALGGYLVLLGTILPAFSARVDGPAWVRILIAALASLQLAALVSQAGHSLLSWGLYVLIGVALAVFAWREPRMREASTVAGAIGLAIAAFWPTPQPAQFALVMVGLVTVFAGVPVAHMWRDRARPVDAMQLGGFAALATIVTVFHYASDPVQPLLAAVIMVYALLAGLGAWLRWTPRDRALRQDSLIPLGACAATAFVAGLVALPSWAAPVSGCVVALALLGLSMGRTEEHVRKFGWAGAIVTLLSLLWWSGFEREMLSFVQGADGADGIRSALRWLALLIPFLWLGLRQDGAWGAGEAAQAIAAIALYGLAAQILPFQVLAWFAALGGIALFIALPRAKAAYLAHFAIAAAWSLALIGPWAIDGVQALAGQPMLIARDGALADVGLYLAPAALMGLVLWLRGIVPDDRFARTGLGWAGLAALCALHIAFKQIFAIGDDAGFVSLGLVERFVWEGVLLASAFAAWRLAPSARSRPVALALVALTLLHFVIFSAGWHNPLLARQDVGEWPIVNWLVPAYLAGGLAVGGLLWLDRSRKPIMRSLLHAAIMTLIVLFAITELRQIYAGPILVGPPVEQTEDVLRSVLGIVLAIGFLLWGAYRGERSWRIGSLALMLLAVLKVFLFDASGLEGLLRIASFMALGFSLIGIGWFYTRQLARQDRAPTADQR